jgi:ATP adenylyltransferase
MAYVEQAQGDEDPEACFLCEKPREGDDAAALILARAGAAYALLNAYPYNPGHLLVAPFRHVAALEDLTDDESRDCQSLLARSVRAIEEEMEPHGFNVGMNLGRVAGAGVPGHLHWHLVPRWNGDTNFMTVLGDVRVLPEALAATYAKLEPRFA